MQFIQNQKRSKYLASLKNPVPRVIYTLDNASLWGKWLVVTFIFSLFFILCNDSVTEQVLRHKILKRLVKLRIRIFTKMCQNSFIINSKVNKSITLSSHKKFGDGELFLWLPRTNKIFNYLEQSLQKCAKSYITAAVLT